MIGIYSILNIVNKKRYIGQSKHIEKRWKEHLYKLRYNKHHNSYLQNAWNLYSENNFKFEVLEECKAEELDEKERYYIKKYNAMNPDYGYCHESGGSSNKQLSLETKKKVSQSLMGHKVTEETILKLKESHKGKHLSNEAKEKLSKAFKGRYVSEETRKRISESNKSKKVTEETKLKLSIAHKGKKWSDEQRQKVIGLGLHKGINNPNYGKQISDFTRQKLRKAHIGQQPWNKAKTMEYGKKVIDVTTGIVYNSISIAEKETGITHIGDCIHGRRKSVCGHVWKFYDEYKAAQ